MVLASDIERRELTGAGGVALGTVTDVLFHPSEPRVVGVVVRPPAALAVAKRPDTYLPLSALTFGEAGTRCDLEALPKGRKAAEGLGYDPDTTVIWMGMPVAGPDSEPVGVASNALFDESTGRVERLDVGAGIVSDVAHGRYLVPGTEVTGYRDGAVRITADVPDLQGSGGFAKTAADGAVVAGRLAHAVGEGVVGASGATGRAIRTVAQADIPKRAAERAKRTWRDSVKAFRDGMKDEE
jgi:PRC-barrel domain